MKIALCVSGLMRTFVKCHESIIKHIIEPNQADLFISTWNVLGVGTYKVPGQPWIPMPGEEKNISEDQIRSTYGDYLKELHIEDWESTQKNFWAELKASRRNKPHWVAHDPRMMAVTHRLASMHYKIGQANRIRKEYENKNGIKYDYVIRGRPDIKHNKTLKLSEYDIKWPDVFCDKEHSYGYVCDQFCFGTSEVLDIYCSVYPKIWKYNNQIAAYNAENMMQHHLLVNGINVITINMDYKVVGLTER